MVKYSLPDLPYAFNALEPHYSAKIVELHHDRYHAAYVAGANATTERLAEAREAGDFGAIVGLEKTLAFNVSGHFLHSIFWKNLSPDDGGHPDGDLAAAIAEHFGSFGGFKEHLTQASSTVQGSGWGALVWEPLGRRLLVEQVYDSWPEHFSWPSWRSGRARSVKGWDGPSTTPSCPANAGLGC